MSCTQNICRKFFLDTFQLVSLGFSHESSLSLWPREDDDDDDGGGEGGEKIFVL